MSHSRALLVELALALNLPAHGVKAVLASRLLDCLQDPGARRRRSGGSAAAATAAAAARSDTPLAATALQWPLLPPFDRGAGEWSGRVPPAFTGTTYGGGNVGGGSLAAGVGAAIPGMRPDALEFLTDPFLTGESPFVLPTAPPLCPPAIVSAVDLGRPALPAVTISFATPVFPVPAAGDDGGQQQLHLRCLRIQTGRPPSTWTQEWPFPVYAAVNSAVVAVAQARRTAAGVAVGPDSGTDLTPHLRPAGSRVSSLNAVTLHRAAGGGSAAAGGAGNATALFVLFVQPVRVVSDAAFGRQVDVQTVAHVERLRVQHGLPRMYADGGATSPLDVAIADAAAFMQGGGVEIESAKVSLRCPLSMGRLTTPVQGVDCRHMQCFDLGMFLAYARRARKYACPVCNRPTASVERLWTSPLLAEALRRFPNADEVEVRTDGSLWLPSPKGGGGEGGGAVASPPTKRQRTIDVSDLCDADADDERGGDGGGEATATGGVGGSSSRANDSAAYDGGAAASAAPPPDTPPEGGSAYSRDEKPAGSVASLPPPLPPPPSSRVVIVDLTGDSD